MTDGKEIMVNRVTAKLPRELRDFVDTTEWTFAKTYALTWPHEYIVREKVNRVLFEALARHICQYGIEQRFYQRLTKYFTEDGLLYWTMGEPIEETTIINRCKEEGAYENRLRNGTLPE